MPLESIKSLRLLDEVLPKLSLLDPACGSGAFLVAALKRLHEIYGQVLGRIVALKNHYLNDKLAMILREHPSRHYYIKKRIITDNLYGVDLMEEATDIAKLRLFLALVASADTVDQLEPLPNIDFNIMAGNSLIGLTRVDPNEFDKKGSDGAVMPALFSGSYQETVDDVNHRIAAYKQNDLYAENLTQAREDIRTLKRTANDTLDGLLLDKFRQQKIQVETATWDDAKNKEGKPQKRALNVQDTQGLTPFHWGFEFHRVLNERGGFDAIITNPPWDILKPNAKEFFQEHSALISKKKMDIKAFEQAQADLLKDPEVRREWLSYLSGFPHQSAYFRTAPGYANQISVVNGKRAGSDINLYKLFTEQCFNLLRDGGQCGIVIPSGIYTDLGAKQLREMLFSQTQVTGLFGFENRKEIFEGVHRSFKFVVLSFTKGGHTEAFPAAFMRLDVKELQDFPQSVTSGTVGVLLTLEVIRKLSPDSVSITELLSAKDVEVSEKLSQFPALRDNTIPVSSISLTNEFHMTSDSKLFHAPPEEGDLPLLEGKMIHQFRKDFAPPRYWINEKEGRRALLSRTEDVGQKLDYQGYRLGFRDIARSTDSRTLICAAIPPMHFCGNTLNISRDLSETELLYLCAVLNSFCVDYSLRQKVSAHVNMFYAYQLSVPRILSTDPRYLPIIQASAKLICTTPEFDALAKAAGLRGHTDGVTGELERAKLRAELDGLVAHLYGLDGEDFEYVLSTFPIVDANVKTAALAAFKRLIPLSGDIEIVNLIGAGESAGLEFKSTARWNMRANMQDKKMEEVIAKTVAAFMNADGGTLLIGVADDGEVLGLEHDFKTLGKKPNRDGFELFLTDLLFKGKLELSGLILISFHELAGKTVCKVAVKPSPEPVWTDVGGMERFFVRTGNSTRELSPRESHGYVRRQWG